jgi:hypothetical protein
MLRGACLCGNVSVIERYPFVGSGSASSYRMNSR